MTRIGIATSALLLAILPAQHAAAQIVGSGKCQFDSGKLSFAGTPLEQAACLLRAPKKNGILDAKPIVLPDPLKARIGQAVDVTKPALRKHLASLSLTEAMVGGSLDEPLSRANDNDSSAPMARYFVIHDTSYPEFNSAPFPVNIDTDPTVNNLRIYDKKEPIAHAFTNRGGQSLVALAFSVPWRATKLEKAVGIPSKGLFIHIENIQPRRRASGDTYNATAPSPGFSDAQYERLVLLYVVASVRGGQWLVPAFHAPVDEGIPGGHDDPQDFDLNGKFAPTLAKLIGKLQQN